MPGRCSGVSKVPNTSTHLTPITTSQEETLPSPGSKVFTIYELKVATNNFRLYTVVETGLHNNVYKGYFDKQTLCPSKEMSSAMAVAVKKWTIESGKGQMEWLTIIDYLGDVNHPNLVKLFGYCLEDENRFLVLEYMPKGSLYHHLFHGFTEALNWETRIKVATGAARGLSFLHDELQIIYRDFNPSNILLDSEFNAKLSECGIVVKTRTTGDETNVEVIGTSGYAAPEYVATGWLSTKHDVYSFGVVLLELLTGRKAYDSNRLLNDKSLVEWAKPYLRNERKVSRIIDPKLQGQVPEKAAFMVATIALHCLNSGPGNRPPMSQVLQQLHNLSTRT